MVEPALGDDVPVIVDPPNPAPADPELKDLAAQVSQVTNLEDLDDLLAETLFGNEELEQLSSQLQAKQESGELPPPPSAAGPVTPAAAETQTQSLLDPPPAAPPPVGNPDDLDMTKAERMAILAAMNGLGTDDDEDEPGPQNAVG